MTSRRALSVLWIPIAILLFTAARPGAAGPAAVTVTAARLLDVETGALLASRVVRIENGLVVSVTERRPGEKVDHDLGDATLLPGLADCHVHLVGGEGLTPDQEMKESTARAAIEGVANARKTLEAGFTTARDLGSRDYADVALRDAIAAGRVPGPRLFVATLSLSSTGGHGDRNGLPSDMLVLRASGVADGPTEIRKRVRENVKHGADWIKILVTGGVTSAGTDPRQADYGEEEIRAAVDAARERGRDVAAHAHGTEGIRRALAAGVRSIEHGSLLDDETIAFFKEKGAFLVSNPLSGRYMLERGASGGYQPYQLRKAEEMLKIRMESLRKAIRAGVAVAFGTDAGVQVHGINARQFAIYVEAGMTPLQAIQSATRTAARLLRLESKIGRVAPGAFGDLVAVRGNPLEDVRVLEAPVFVMKDGEVVFRR